MYTNNYKVKSQALLFIEEMTEKYGKVCIFTKHEDYSEKTKPATFQVTVIDKHEIIKIFTPEGLSFNCE